MYLNLAAEGCQLDRVTLAAWMVVKRRWMEVEIVQLLGNRYIYLYGSLFVNWTAFISKCF